MKINKELLEKVMQKLADHKLVYECAAVLNYYGQEKHLHWIDTCMQTEEGWRLLLAEKDGLARVAVELICAHKEDDPYPCDDIGELDKRLGALARA